MGVMFIYHILYIIYKFYLLSFMEINGSNCLSKNAHMNVLWFYTNAGENNCYENNNINVSIVRILKKRATQDQPNKLKI